MHVITTFVELSNTFSHHSITHGIFTVYFTYLTMNISQFHISCIQKTYNRPHFTVGRVLDHLEHFKCTEQYINTLCFSCIGICGLPVNKGRQRACAKSQPQRCGGNICKQYLLSEYALYIKWTGIIFWFWGFFLVCKNPKTKIQYSFHSESLKSRWTGITWHGGRKYFDWGIIYLNFFL